MHQTHLPRACRGRTAVRFPANSSHVCCLELALKALASAGKGLLYTGFLRSLTDGYLMLMSPKQLAKQVSMVTCLCVCVR